MYFGLLKYSQFLTLKCLYRYCIYSIKCCVCKQMTILDLCTFLKNPAVQQTTSLPTWIFWSAACSCGHLEEKITQCSFNVFTSHSRFPHFQLVSSFKNAVDLKSSCPRSSNTHLKIKEKEEHNWLSILFHKIQIFYWLDSVSTWLTVPCRALRVNVFPLNFALPRIIQMLVSL